MKNTLTNLAFLGMFALSSIGLNGCAVYYDNSNKDKKIASAIPGECIKGIHIKDHTYENGLYLPHRHVLCENNEDKLEWFTRYETFSNWTKMKNKTINDIGIFFK